MTCVIACKTDDNKVVVITDSAIGYENGFRRLMSEAKIWDMGCLVVGESGSDFALSRIRQKTVKYDPWEALRDPYTFSELVCTVQTEVKGDEGPEPLEAELLHIGACSEGMATLHVIGGDGGITGPFPYTAVGHGATVALPLMDALLLEKRIKKRSTVKVTNVLLEIMNIVASYADSVCGPFHHKIFDPDSKFKEL